MNSKIRDYIFYTAAILLVLSAALYITEWKFIPYVYAVAGAIVAVAYLSNPYRGKNLRMKRMNIQEAIAAILLPLSSYYMFHRQNEWFLFLAISAILQLYAAWVKSVEAKKEND